MELKTDSQGFLIGDPVNLIDLAEEWKQVSADTRAIRSMVSKIAAALASKNLSEAPAPQSARMERFGPSTQKPRERNQKGEKVVKHVVEIAEPKTRSAPEKKSERVAAVPGKPAKKTPDQAQSSGHVAIPAASDTAAKSKSTGHEVASRAAAVPMARSDGGSNRRQRGERGAESESGRTRDGRGRFVKRDIASGGSALSLPEKGGSGLSAINEVADKLAGLVKNTGEGIGESDPAVQAMQEIAQPISAGLEMFGFGSGKEEGWLRRIFRSIRDFRKEESTFNKAQNKTLKKIAETPQGGGGGIGESGSLLVGGAKNIGLGALSLAKGLAKRVPLLGALIEGGSSLVDIFRSENDGTKTRAEKDASTGKAAGKGIGAIGGTLLGASKGAALGSLLGPVGTAVGTIVGGAAGAFFGGSAGSIVGEKIGSFVGYLREADIPGKISSVWTGFTESLKSGWEGALDKLSNLWDKGKEAVGGAVDKANGWVKEKTGVDVIGSIKGAFSNEGVIGRHFVRPKDEDYRPGRKKTDPWQLGATSELYESGNRGAGAISSGKGDHGGASYGMYQLSSSKGSVQKFIKDAGYDELFEGKEVGSEEFNETWRNLAKFDPTFAAEQRSFVKREYYDKAQESLKEKGLDMTGRGRAVQDAIWSTSVQFGAGGAANMLQKSLKGKDVSKMSDAEIVTALQDYKIENNSKLFKSSSLGVRLGTLNRAQDEKKRLVALAASDASPVGRTDIVQPKNYVTTTQTAVATARAARAPQSKPATAATTMARVEQPVGTLAEPKPVVVNVQGEIGQDVKDRSIAHIVTGGIAT